MTSIGTLEQKLNFHEYMEILKGKSAMYPEKGPPGTVILYSGQDLELSKSNKKLAIDCSRKLENTYTIHRTKAGNYMDIQMRDAWNAGKISDSQYSELWDEASRMLVNQAQGPALAVTPGGELEMYSTFLRVEMHEIMNGRTGITSINGVPIKAVRYDGINEPKYGMATLNVNTAEECKEQPAKQPLNAIDRILQNFKAIHLPQFPDRDLEELENPGGGFRPLSPSFLPGRRVDNQPQDEQFKNFMANNPKLAENIENARASLKHSGVDLREVERANSAPQIRAELAANKTADRTYAV